MPKRKVPSEYVSEARIRRATRYRAIGLTPYETALIMKIHPVQVRRFLKYNDDGVTRSKWLKMRKSVSTAYSEHLTDPDEV